MGMKVRRILFEGHLLFSARDVAEFLGIGDLSPKLKKAGLMPLLLPLPKEMVKTEEGPGCFWLTWDDIYKMDQRFKWGGAEIGRKVHMLRMWSRNKDADAYYLTREGEMELKEKRPEGLKVLTQFIETVMDGSYQEQKMAKKAKHEQEKKAVDAFYGKVAQQKAVTPKIQPVQLDLALPTSQPSMTKEEPVQSKQEDTNLELMALVESVQIEAIKERKEMWKQMEEMVRAERANNQAIMQQLVDIAKAALNNKAPLTTVDTPLADWDQMEIPRPVTSTEAIALQEQAAEIAVPTETVTVVTEPKQAVREKKLNARGEEYKRGPYTGKSKKFTYDGPPAVDPLPGQPPIIGRDERKGAYVRAQAGTGYMTARQYLSSQNKPLERKIRNSKDKKRYYVQLSAKAYAIAKKEGRRAELYHVPSTNPSRAWNVNSSNETAYPIDILAKAFPFVEFN